MTHANDLEKGSLTTHSRWYKPNYRIFIKQGSMFYSNCAQIKHLLYIKLGMKNLESYIKIHGQTDNIPNKYFPSNILWEIDHQLPCPAEDTALRRDIMLALLFHMNNYNRED